MNRSKASAQSSGDDVATRGSGRGRTPLRVPY